MGTIGKAKAGKGDTLNIIFKKRTGNDLKALSFSQSLASKNIRSEYVTDILCALYNVWYSTGSFPDSDQIIAQIYQANGVVPPFAPAPELDEV